MTINKYSFGNHKNYQEGDIVVWRGNDPCIGKIKKRTQDSSCFYISEEYNSLHINNLRYANDDEIELLLNSGKTTIRYTLKSEDNFENTQMENKETKTEKYVVMVEGKSIPTKVHENYETAEREAKRLCEKERRNAHVLKIVSLIELPPVEFKITKF